MRDPVSLQNIYLMSKCFGGTLSSPFLKLQSSHLEYKYLKPRRAKLLDLKTVKVKKGSFSTRLLLNF